MDAEKPAVSCSDGSLDARRAMRDFSHLKRVIFPSDCDDHALFLVRGFLESLC